MGRAVRNTSPDVAPTNRGSGLLPGIAAAAASLLLGIYLWWHVWSGHPTSVASCGCGDPALTTWFLEWPAHALQHGHRPYFSTALAYPGGVNLLSNTGILALGLRSRQ